MLFDVSGSVSSAVCSHRCVVIDSHKVAPHLWVNIVLTVPQIIKMSDSMTMMFEAEDLEQASPATVSRVGMIFCEIRNLDWQPLRDVWLDSLPVTFEEHRPLIVGLFDWLFPAALYFVQKQCVIPTPVTGQVSNSEIQAATTRSKMPALHWDVTPFVRFMNARYVNFAVL